MHSLTDTTQDLTTHSLTHSLTPHSHSQASAETSSLTHSLIRTTHSITDETAEGPAVPRDCRRACGARGRRWAGSLRSVQRLQKGLRRAWSPLGRLSPQCPETAAGPAAQKAAVSRDCRRACSVQRLQKGLRGAWSPLGRLSPQCPETAEGPAAQKAAVSRDCRRACSVQRLQKGLQCPETAEGSAARVVGAGPALSAVSRDCRRACGARGRRWAGSLRSVQRLQKGLRRRRPQCPETAEGPAVSRDCPETAEGPAARVVAAGPALSAVSRDCSARGRRWAGSLRSVQRLQKGLRRAWSPLGRLSPQCPLQKGLRRAWSPLGLGGSVSRDCRRPQCPETAEGPAAPLRSCALLPL